MMKKLFAAILVSTAVFGSQFVHAGTICEAKSALGDARANLVKMIGTSDNAEQKALKVKIDEASVTLEASIAALMGDGKSDNGQVTALEKTWSEFKLTRETEIVPAVYAGDNAKAKAIATGIQADRMKTMNGAVSALGGDAC